MNWRAIRTVISKDLRVVLRSPMILTPMIILPVLMQVVIPGAMGLALTFAPETLSEDIEDLDIMLDAMPPGILEQFEAMSERELFLQLILVYLFAPLYLIVPMMVSSVIAADSFVGEKERKTIEALLHTPLTDTEMLLAKMLGAWLAAVAVGVIAFILYSVVVNLVGWPIMGRIFFPNALWFVLVLWVAPAVAGLGLGITVLISTRVKTFQEAYQLGGIVVVPIVALVLAQAAGVIYLSVGLTIGLGAAIWVVDAVIFWFGVETFKREKLLAQL